MRLPKKLSGTHALVGWGNALIDWLMTDRLVSVVGGKLQQTTAGRVLTIDAGAGGGLKIERLALREVKDDYLVCRSWDGETEGDTDIYVAKSPKLRNSVTEETLDGTDYTYTYSASFVERVSTNTDDDTTETQKIVPRWIVGDEVFAIRTPTSIQTEDADDISLLDLNVDGRAWAAQSNG